MHSARIAEMAKLVISSLHRSLQRLQAVDFPGATCSSTRSLITTATISQRSSYFSNSEIEAADPFLSKLQKQTEAGYLELLARKDEVPDTEEDRLAEEEIEVSMASLWSRWESLR